MDSGLGSLMQQAQQLQAQLQKARDSLASLEVTGQSGAGMVQVVMTGQHEIRRVIIEPALLQEKKSVLEDLVAAAVNDAANKVREQAGKRLADLTGGMFTGFPL